MESTTTSTTTTTTTPTIASGTRATDSDNDVTQRLDENSQQKLQTAASHQCPDCDAKFVHR